ncbi:hypothetical protein [Streptomyces sp. NPDC055886]
MRLTLWKKNTRKQTNLIEAALNTALETLRERRKDLTDKTQAILNAINEKDDPPWKPHPLTPSKNSATDSPKHSTKSVSYAPHSSTPSKATETNSTEEDGPPPSAKNSLLNTCPCAYADSSLTSHKQHDLGGPISRYRAR